MPSEIFRASRIFDGYQWHQKAALIVEQGQVVEIRPDQGEGQWIEGDIVPGLIDLQVNGGGGVLFNNDPTAAGIAQICKAHAGFGTTAVMITLITDTAEVTAKAIAAGRDSLSTHGFMGLHLEGPHIDLARKGTHDPALVRKMEPADVQMISEAAAALPHLICTLAPGSVSLEQVAALSAAGAVVSLGHSDATAEVAQAYLQGGAAMVTHLYNAMSQLGHRAPGLVGAALADPDVWAGLIADGFHVNDIAMKVALQAKERLFLVSDTMSTIGTDLTGFTLNGRQIYRKEGRLTLADGTLAGADIALIDALRYVVTRLGLPLERGLQLASLHPAKAMGDESRGHLLSGARADFTALSPALSALGTWISGVRQ